MNFSEYEQKHEALYTEFASVVRFIIDTTLTASSGTTDCPRPQSIQCRAKAASHLKPKLEERGLLGCADIETRIKDLAGVRVILYTNTDVDRLLQCRIVPESFEVEWDETRVHQPLQADAEQHYRAIHYTVRLTAARLALPEYARFKGMRCEIQIQTILNHAWSETSHDILYKRPLAPGFGSREMQSIKKRIMRIMDEHLLPAGYELQKVQLDFQRLMEGKALFERGEVAALARCSNNSERCEVLRRMRDYLLPHYDDIRLVWPDIVAALLSAFDCSRQSDTELVETTFGRLPGATSQDVTCEILKVLRDLRYLDVARTLDALIHLFCGEQDGRAGSDILTEVRRLAEYNLGAWRQIGPGVQGELLDAIERQMGASDREARSPVFIAVWREVLSSELNGTSFGPNSVTISRGAVPVSDALAAIRARAIDGLLELFDNATSESSQRESFRSVWEASRLPTEGLSSPSGALVLRDTETVIARLTARVAAMSYELRQHIEHEILYAYRRAREIADDASDRFRCKAEAERLASAILRFRDAANADLAYVRYKTLVGFESTFPPSWDDLDFDYAAAEQFRKSAADGYVNRIAASGEEEWFDLLERCAATRSDDLATFPIFCHFLVRLSARHPDIAVRVLDRASPNLAAFLPAFLNGLHESGATDLHRNAVAARIRADGPLRAIARHWQSHPPEDVASAFQLLDTAVASEDGAAVTECVALAVTVDASARPFPTAFFQTALEYLAQSGDARWIRAVAFLPASRAFFRTLTKEDTQATLNGLVAVPQIGSDAERILAAIAASHPRLVWAFLGDRLARERDPAGTYEASPYRFHELNQVLSTDVDVAISIVQDWYETSNDLFVYRGARVLAAVFPELSPSLLAAIRCVTARGSDQDIGFALCILKAYGGHTGTVELAKEIVALLPEDDLRLSSVEASLSVTGVVSGEFGMVEAFQRRQAEILPWLEGESLRLKNFAARLSSRLTQRIASEQRSAEMRVEMRRREYPPEETGA